MWEPRGFTSGAINVSGLVHARSGCSSLKSTVVFRGPLILMMPISGQHIDLDQLKDEATP